MFEKLNLLMLMVADIEKSAAFYRDVLGLRQKAERIFLLGDVELMLQHTVKDLADERPVKHGITLGFKVPDVNSCHAELKRRGAHVLVAPRDGELGRFAEIVDPDGHVITFFQ